MVTGSDSARDSVAVTVTDKPSVTGFGEAESMTVGGGGGTVRLRETVSSMDQLRPVLDQVSALLGMLFTEAKEPSAKGNVALSICSVETDFRLAGIVLSNMMPKVPVEPKRIFVM